MFMTTAIRPGITPSARLIVRQSVASSMMASLAFPAFARDGRGPMPENAVRGAMAAAGILRPDIA